MLKIVAASVLSFVIGSALMLGVMSTKLAIEKNTVAILLQSDSEMVHSLTKSVDNYQQMLGLVAEVGLEFKARAAALDAMLDEPRGIRTNNPGNIIKDKRNKWRGATACMDSFECFVRPEYGIRALIKVLHTYHYKHGLVTLRGIITRWSSTDQEDYLDFVSGELGLDPNEQFTFDNPAFVAALTESIIYFENGKQPYNRDMILEIAVYEDWIEGADNVYSEM